jgi:hypothetical protein
MGPGAWVAGTAEASGAVVEAMLLYWIDPVMPPWVPIGPPGSAEPSPEDRGSEKPANVDPPKLILTL